MKLFSITQDQIMSGISSSVHFKNRGLWWKAKGINPFVYPFYESDESGILQSCPTPVDISSTVVVDSIVAGVPVVTGLVGGNLYMIGNSNIYTTTGGGTTGHFYNKNLADDNAPTDLRSGTTITDPANSVEIYQVSGGTKYLYYWQAGQIGRWDMQGSYPTGWQDNWATGLQATGYHPTVRLRGNIYYGNKDRIGVIYDSSGTPTNNTNVLDFEGEFSCMCTAQDGTYLIAGLSSNTLSATFRSETKIIFWDTFSSSWNKEWPVPDFGIIAIQPYKTGFIAICQRGIYYFDYYNKPKKIRDISARIGATNAASVFNEAVLFGANGPYVVASYGKMIPEAPYEIYSEPFSNIGSTSDVSFIDATTQRARIFVATYDPELFYIPINVGGATGILAETVYIPLKDEYKINHLEFHLAEPLASGDACTVSLQRDEDTAAFDLPALSYANYSSLKKIPVDTFFVADQVKFKFNFSAGNVKIKQIDVYGEPNRDRKR